MTPIFLLGSVFNALAAPALEIAPRVSIAGDAGTAAVRPVPAMLRGVQGLSVLAAPISALTAISPAGVSAAPAAKADAAPLAAEPAAVPAPSPAGGASDFSASRISDRELTKPFARIRSTDGSAVGMAPAHAFSADQAFRRFLKGIASAHPALAGALGGDKIFDGASERGILSRAGAEPSAASGGRRDFLPRSTDLSLRKSRSAPLSASADAVQGTALDADPKDAASIEKALRALVDSNPAKYGAPSAQLAKISVSILPSILEGQGASIIAVFRQALSGADNDGLPYELGVSGKSLTFHIKVFKDGKPVVMSESGELAPGVTADVMKVAFDDAQLQAIAAKRALSPPDQARGASVRGGKTKSSPLGKNAPRKLDLARRKGGKPAPDSKTKKNPAPRTRPHPRQGKTKPRGGDSADQAEAAPADAPALAAPKFLSRQLTDELDGKWRTVNIYQAAGPKGEPLIVIVDVKSGEAFAISANNFRTGESGPEVKRLISGTVSGRATLPDANGEDHGPIGPIVLPLTNVYDASGKVVAVTDEQGNFSIPDDGGTAPVKLTIRLASPLVPFVRDENAKQNGPVEVTVTATPGQKLTVMLNPVGANPESAANVVGYVGYLRHHIWVKGLPGMDAARMDAPLAGGIVVNGHEEQGNAFYDPSNDSVNLMAAAVITVRDAHGKPVKLKVENTAVWSIEDHENTHRVVQTYSQIQLTAEQKASPVYRFVKWSMDTIMGSDVNESIADVVSYFMRKMSTIGGGFYGNPPPGQPDYIRSAEDKTPYDPKNPDPHNGVLAQSMWATRQAFIDKLGQAAGESYANAMIPLILISQPLNPIDALFHMVLWDLREDGSSPFGDLIRRIAKDDHGIDLPPTPTAPVPMA